MDRRKAFRTPQTIRNDKVEKYAWAYYLIYILLGSILAFAVWQIPSVFYAVLFFFIYIMFMTVFIVVAEFSTVLLDTSDNLIIVPRPVSGRTLAAVRLAYVTIHIAKIILSLAILPLLAISIKFSFLLALPLLLLLIPHAIINLLTVNAIYLLAIRFTNEERLKSILNLLQIFTTILFTGASTLVTRIYDKLDWQHFDEFKLIWWHYVVPPSWPAATIEGLANHSLTTAQQFIFLLLNILLPVLGFVLMNKYLSPSLSRKLASLNRSKESKKPKSTWRGQTFKITTTGPEQGAYQFVHHIFSRDQQFKLKIYPLFVYMLIISLSPFLGNLDELSSSSVYIFTLYSFSLVLPAALTETSYSENYQAAWIYRAAPILQPGEILVGAFKASFFRSFLLAYLVATPVFLYVWRSVIIDDLLFAFLNMVILSITLLLYQAKRLPASVSGANVIQGLRFGKIILLLFANGVLALVHFLFVTIFMASLIWLMPFQLIAIVWLMRRYRSTSWKQIQG